MFHIWFISDIQSVFKAKKLENPKPQLFLDCASLRHYCFDAHSQDTTVINKLQFLPLLGKKMYIKAEVHYEIDPLDRKEALDQIPQDIRISESPH